MSASVFSLVTDAESKFRAGGTEGFGAGASEPEVNGSTVAFAAEEAAGFEGAGGTSVSKG